MEIPVINQMTDSLNNPSLISRLLSTFELGKLTHARRFWKWDALFLALLYAFNSLINKIKIIIYYYHNKSKSLIADASEPLLSHFDDAFQSDDDEDDVVCSTSASSCDDEDNYDYEEEEETKYVDDDFNVKSSFRNCSESPRQKSKFKLLRRRRSFVDNFSLSDFVSGNGVVKLWDGLSLGVVDVDNAFSFLDFNFSENNDLISGSIFEAVSTSSPVFLSANSGLSIWDLRTGEKKPAVHSEWKSDRKGKIVGVDSCRTGKVYVTDDVTKGLVVGDVRKIHSPLKGELTDYEDDMWCDADGVIGFDESTSEFGD